MIKVIHVPGVPKHMKHQYRVTCGRCGTIFECDDNDFHTEIVGHGDSDDLVYCPTCNESCSWRLSPHWCKVEVIH